MASSALSLLAGYDSDDEGDSKDQPDDEKTQIGPADSTKPRLPLPGEIKALFEKEAKTLCPGMFLICHLTL